LLSDLFAPREEGGPQTNWKANGRFPFVWLRRRSRSRDTVQIVVFVGGPLSEAMTPYGTLQMKMERNVSLPQKIKNQNEKNYPASLCAGSFFVFTFFLGGVFSEIQKPSGTNKTNHQCPSF